MCGVQLKDRVEDFMLMSGLSKTIDPFAMANSVHWHGHVLRREDGHIWRRGFWDFEGWSKEEREKAG